MSCSDCSTGAEAARLPSHPTCDIELPSFLPPPPSFLLWPPIIRQTASFPDCQLASSTSNKPLCYSQFPTRSTYSFYLFLARPFPLRDSLHRLRSLHACLLLSVCKYITYTHT